MKRKAVLGAVGAIAACAGCASSGPPVPALGEATCAKLSVAEVSELVGDDVASTMATKLLPLDGAASGGRSMLALDCLYLLAGGGSVTLGFAVGDDPDGYFAFVRQGVTGGETDVPGIGDAAFLPRSAPVVEVLRGAYVFSVDVAIAGRDAVSKGYEEERLARLVASRL